MNEVLENLKMWSADPLCVAAAKQIEEWTAENDRLRAALREIRFAVGTSTEAYHIARLALGDEQTADQKLPPMCDDCGTNRADPPSKLCPGCQAYQEHQR